MPPERVGERVRCPHTQCDGCALIGLPYGEQLAAKGKAVHAAFTPYPTLKRIKRRPPMAAPALHGYRRRVKLALGQAGRQVRAGLFRRGTRDLQPIPDCPVTAPEVRNLVAQVTKVLAAEGGCYPEGPIKGIDVRLGSGPAPLALTLVLEREEMEVGDLPVGAIREACPGLHLVAVNLNPGGTPLALGPRTAVVWGEPRTQVDVAEQPIWLSPGAFFQVNTPQLEAIHRKLIGFFSPHQPGGRLLDLYCGSGVHALGLADRFDEVVGVDTVEQAVGDAVESTRRRELGHLTFEQADAAVRGAELLTQTWSAAVVNPPRAGLPPSLRDALCESPPERLAYVSCSPVTLSRDLHHLARRGYVVRTVTPLDMMPLTNQVECLALLEPQPGARDHGVAPAVREGEGGRYLRLDPFGPDAIQVDTEQAPLPRIGEGSLRPPLHLDASGIVEVAPADEDLAYQVMALVVGRLPARGSVPPEAIERAGARGSARFELVAEVADHSLVKLRVKGTDPENLRRALRGFRHPVIGDRRSGLRNVNHFFAERYGLDRAFFHVSEVDGPPPRAARRWTLASDLQAVLDQAGPPRPHASHA